MLFGEQRTKESIFIGETTQFISGEPVNRYPPWVGNGSYHITEQHTVKPVVSGHSKRRPKLVFWTDYLKMQVKSIAECSKRAFCNTFDLH